MPSKKRDMLKMDKVRSDIKELVIHVVSEMSPNKLIRRNLEVKGHNLNIAGKYRVSLEKINKLYIVGFGKASGAMAVEAEKILGRYLSDGCVSILRGTKEKAAEILQEEFLDAFRYFLIILFITNNRTKLYKSLTKSGLIRNVLNF